MAYFKVNDVDLSSYIASLSVKETNNYVAQTNALGDAVVDYLTAKKIIEVDVIPLMENDYHTVMATLTFNPTVKYRDPSTGNLVSANCILDDKQSEYYTIQTNKVMFKKMRLKFKEL